MTTEITRFNPADEFRSMQRLMDRLWSGMPRAMREDVDMTHVEDALAVDVYEKDGNLVVKTALPGVDRKDIDINVSDGILYIRAEMQAEADVKDENWHRREFRYGKASRSFRLPPDLDVAKATAKYENGILRLSFPLTTAAKSKSIHVNVT